MAAQLDKGDEQRRDFKGIYAECATILRQASETPLPLPQRAPCSLNTKLNTQHALNTELNTKPYALNPPMAAAVPAPWQPAAGHSTACPAGGVLEPSYLNPKPWTLVFKP